MSKNLYNKVFDKHTVRQLDGGQYQLFIGLHLIHEVTSPQAFSMLKERGLSVLYPDRTFGVCDHIIPTTTRIRPFADESAETMLTTLEANCKENGIRYFSPEEGAQGVVHVVGPEQGLVQPGMTICCGDSHTSTHGAFGSIAFGIGTSTVRDVLATQTLSMAKLKVRKIEINGSLGPFVTAKDIALYIISKLGVEGGIGYAYEYAGDAVTQLSMEGRMTLCNMSIEGGARCGYVNPDEKTYAYIKGRPYAPKGKDFEKAVEYWESIKSDASAQYDEVVVFDGADIQPMVTWGINPAQAIGVNEDIPSLGQVPAEQKNAVQEACDYMDVKPGAPMKGTPVDVCFLGSCTNGRLSDFEQVAAYLKTSGKKVAPGVQALAVPGSTQVRNALIEKGLDKVFMNAGFEFRQSGCSMCLAMNPDKLKGRQLCASSSNRNFKGRQGSPSGRTVLMSPIMVAAAAVTGAISDAREVFKDDGGDQ